MPKISVVIPNLNSTFIDQTLDALRNQIFDMTKVEVLVVGLDIPNLIREDSLVKFIKTEKPTRPSIARNIGIKASQGEIICFTDADCLPSPNWLRLIDFIFSNCPEKQVLGGGIAIETDNYWTWCDNLSWFHEFLVTTDQGKRDFLPSLNLAVARSVIETVGLFDESYSKAAAEDADWTLRMYQAGVELYFDPQASVTHCPKRSTLINIWQHAFIYGRYSTKINPKYHSFIKPPVFLQHWFILLALTPFLASWGTWKIILTVKGSPTILQAVPGIYLSKLAWCLGAVVTLYRGGIFDDYP